MTWLVKNKHADKAVFITTIVFAYGGTSYNSPNEMVIPQNGQIGLGCSYDPGPPAVHYKYTIFNIEAR